MDLTRLSAIALLQGLAAKTFSAHDVAVSHFDRIQRFDPEIHAFLRCDPDEVLAQARSIDERRAQGRPLGSLAGVPVALKDNLCVRNSPTTCGSRMLRDYRPPFEATVVERLRAADALLIGKTNMDEFAMGSSTENSHFGPTKNPWDPTRTPGGSSGGSTAAVAAGFAPLALGSDTGGSIRQPAALCGVVGLKPTYGRVSRFGLVAFASSLDQIGPIARDADDAALLLQAIAGHDPNDATCVDLEVPRYAEQSQPGQRLRVGVVDEFFGEGLDAEVGASLETAIATFERAGAEIKRAALPHSKYGIPAYYIVATAECSSNLARYDGTIFGHRAADWSPRNEREADIPPLIRMMMASRAEGFGDEVKRRIMLGTFALSAGYADKYYNQALKVRRLIRNDFDAAFHEVDVLIGPTSPTAAFRLGEKVSDPLAMYLSDIYTITANLAGIGGISIPCGLTRLGLPIGLQLLASSFHETTLLDAARLFQRHTDWHDQRPHFGDRTAP
jgi:aspartyl-tRNA(Asn)/glutamyl-tRNA(Gln) amidotransferase subunit A